MSLIYIPLFGEVAPDDQNAENERSYLDAPHIKAWGLLIANEFLLLHSEPAATHTKLFETVGLFDAERALIEVIDEDDTTLPDAVWARLAEYRLLGAEA